MYECGILTSSDMCFRGEREDISGATIHKVLLSLGFTIARYQILPDELDSISACLREWTDVHNLRLIITTGGTGLTVRDIVPEATISVLERFAPGIAEAVRSAGQAKTPTAMLSRGTAGIRRQTLIINLPGSPKAVSEGLEVLIPILPHALGQLSGTDRGH